MNKNEKAALILKEHQEWRMGGDAEPTNPQALTSAIYHAIDALTQAAEIERGDNVVVDVEQYRREAHKIVGIAYRPRGKCFKPSDFPGIKHYADQGYFLRLGDMMHHLLNITASGVRDE